MALKRNSLQVGVSGGVLRAQGDDLYVPLRVQEVSKDAYFKLSQESSHVSLLPLCVGCVCVHAHTCMHTHTRDIAQ